VSPNGEMLQAVQEVRTSAMTVVALCDSLLLGTRWDSEQALRLLPPALRRLSITQTRAIAALEAEGIT
jgi:hypothetical protein